MGTWGDGPQLHAVMLQLSQICTECSALCHGGNSGLDQGTSILLLSFATNSSYLRCESLALGRGTGCLLGVDQITSHGGI